MEVHSKTVLSLLRIEAVCEIKRVGVYDRAHQMNIIIFRDRWNLQRFICLALRHSSRVLGVAAKMLTFKGRALSPLEVFAMFC